jgi:hypothetical protein
MLYDQDHPECVSEECFLITFANAEIEKGYYFNESGISGFYGSS